MLKRADPFLKLGSKIHPGSPHRRVAHQKNLKHLNNSEKNIKNIFCLKLKKWRPSGPARPDPTLARRVGGLAHPARPVVAGSKHHPNPPKMAGWQAGLPSPTHFATLT